MTTKVVTTQQDLDAALSDSDVNVIHIESSSGVCLHLESSGSATVQAYGSATVRAYCSATVRASGSATVQAYGSATVQAYGSATVQASDSATVQASDSATVQASGSATVRAYGSATVRASDSATVHAYGSATVQASGSATVRASDSATVHAYGSATVRASPQVAVHLHSMRATVTGGVLIDLTALDLTDPRTWAEHHGVTVVTDRAVGDNERYDSDLDLDGDHAILYKAVSPELTAGEQYDRPTTYAIGTTVTAADWRDDHECGGGLHVSPAPFQAERFRNGEIGTRFLRVAAPVVHLRPISSDKAKCRSVRVLAEVDINGDVMAGVQ